MISSGQTTVGTAVPVQIDGSSANPIHLTIHNNDNTKALFVGGADLTSANGLVIKKEETLQLTLYPGERLFALSSSGDHIISWLRQQL